MTRVRPAEFEDFDAIRDLSARTGLYAFDPEEMRQWRLSFPFRRQFEGVPIGWVLETDAREIVGTFANIHMAYEFAGELVKCGIGGAWGVDVRHRSGSLQLLMAYFQQTGVDVCLNGSASGVASQLFTALKTRRIPSPDYDLAYFWITRRQVFAEATLRKKKAPAARLLSYGAAAALWAADLRNLRRVDCDAVRRLNGFGPEFDALWEKLRSGPRRLRAVRTAAALDWRIGGAARAGRALVLGSFRDGNLAGYAVLRVKEQPELKLRRFVLFDLQAIDDDPGVLSELLAASIETARKEKVDALEWQGWAAPKRRGAAAFHPRSYRYPVWPLFYQARRPDLAASLESADVWDFSPFDAF